jgi:hypothetical protein
VPGPAANGIALAVAAIIVGLIVWPWPFGGRPFAPLHLATTFLAVLAVGLLLWLRSRS